MYLVSEQSLRFLSNYYHEIQEKLERTSEQLSYAAESDFLHLHVDYIIDVLRGCSQAMDESKQIVKMYQEILEQKEKLKRELKKYENEIQRLQCQNQSLDAGMQQLKNQFQSEISDLEKNYLQIVQMEREGKDRITKEYLDSQICWRLRISKIESEMQQKEKIIQSLHHQLANQQIQGCLKHNQLELAQLVLQDLWRKKEELESQKYSKLWGTYSPSPSSSVQSSIQPQTSSFACNRKRSSLLQDLFQSQITYKQPPVSSHFRRQKDRVVLMDEQRQRWRYLSEVSFSNRLSPTSISSSKECINCRLKNEFNRCKQTKEIYIQTEEYGVAHQLYKWIKQKIVCQRIKKH